MGGIDSHFSGAASEQYVRGYLLATGKEVFVPLLGQSKCDLIYLDDDRAVRVQVKTATWNYSSGHGYEQCRLAFDGRRKLGKSKAYTAEDIDELWVVGTHLWRFPVEKIAGRSSLCLGSDHPDPQTRAKDYDPEGHVVQHGTMPRTIRY